MTEKELKELEKFVKENGYNDELKDIYLREVIDRNNAYFSYKFKIFYFFIFLIS